jgi:hypothetical protein
VRPSRAKVLFLETGTTVPGVISLLPFTTESVLMLSCCTDCWRPMIWSVSAARCAWRLASSSGAGRAPSAVISASKVVTSAWRRVSWPSVAVTRARCWDSKSCARNERYARATASTRRAAAEAVGPEMARTITLVPGMVPGVLPSSSGGLRPRPAFPSNAMARLPTVWVSSIARSSCASAVGDVPDGCAR